MTEPPPPKRYPSRAVKFEYVELKLSEPISAEEEEPAPTVPKKRKKKQLKYAPPEDYAHLPQSIPDYVAPCLDILFCGFNPGVKSAARGHHYAGPNNAFWKGISQSGLVEGTLTFEDDWRLPAEYNMGLTNICERPTRSSAELSRKEIVKDGVVLDDKIKTLRPRIACFVGKGVYEAYTRKPCRTWGLQPETTRHTVKSSPELVSPNQAAELVKNEKVDDTKDGRDEKVDFTEDAKDVKADVTGDVKHEKVDGPKDAKDEKVCASEHATEKKVDVIEHVKDENNNEVYETKLFVMPSTSGRTVGISIAEKIGYFRALKRLRDESRTETSAFVQVKKESTSI